jgi:hypothetical protein
LCTGFNVLSPCTFSQCKIASCIEYFQRIDSENKRTFYLELSVDVNSKNKDTFVVPLTEKQKDSLLNRIWKRDY